MPPSPPSLPLYLVLPNEKGTYLYLIMCLICRFIVRKNKAKKYISKMGQKTGILKLWRGGGSPSTLVSLLKGKGEATASFTRGGRRVDSADRGERSRVRV